MMPWGAAMEQTPSEPKNTLAVMLRSTLRRQAENERRRPRRVQNDSPAVLTCRVQETAAGEKRGGTDLMTFALEDFLKQSGRKKNQTIRRG